MPRELFKNQTELHLLLLLGQSVSECERAKRFERDRLGIKPVNEQQYQECVSVFLVSSNTQHPIEDEREREIIG